MPSVRKTYSKVAPIPAKANEPLSEDNLFEEKAIQVSSVTRVRTINHNLPDDSSKKKLFPEAFDENRNPSQQNVRKRPSLEQSEFERAEFGVPLPEPARIFEDVPVQSVEEPVSVIQPRQTHKVLPTATPLLSIVKAVASPKAAHRRTPLTIQERTRATPANQVKASARKKSSPPVDILDDFQSHSQVRRKISLGTQDQPSAEDLQATPAPAPKTNSPASTTERKAPARRTTPTPRTIKRKTSIGAAKRSSLSAATTTAETVEPEIVEHSMEAEPKAQVEETPQPQTEAETPAEMKQTSVDTTPQKPAADEPLVISIPPPPPIETLSLFDTAVLTELKENEKPFITDGDRADIEAFLDSFTSPDISKFLIPVSIIGEGTFSTVYKVIDLNYYDCDNSHWSNYSRQNQLDYLRLWRWFFAQNETVVDELVIFKNGKRAEFKKPARSQAGTSLYALIRNFFYDWAWRGLNALSKEISIDKLDPILLPSLLQAKMFQFRPHFIALKRINATSSPSRVLDELKFLQELGGKHNVVPLINGYRCEDQIVVTFPYFHSEDFRDFLSNNATYNIKNIASYMKALFIALAHMHHHKIIHRDVKPSNFLFSNDLKDGPRAVLVDFGLAQRSGPKGLGEESFSKEMDSKNAERERRRLLAADSFINSFAQSIDFTGVYDRTEKVNMIMNHLGPGHFMNDPRAPMKASRAGTRGFRAPEVLFKCANQSVALDIWSAGVILLTLLTRRYPFFQSSDDLDAILEIACIFGQFQMTTAAKNYGRKWICSIPSIPEQHITWPELCFRLNPTFAPEIPPECFDLLAHCLQLNADRRITARHALHHPFIKKYAN